MIRHLSQMLNTDGIPQYIMRVSVDATGPWRAGRGRLIKSSGRSVRGLLGRLLGDSVLPSPTHCRGGREGNVSPGTRMLEGCANFSRPIATSWSGNPVMESFGIRFSSRAGGGRGVSQPATTRVADVCIVDGPRVPPRAQSVAQPLASRANDGEVTEWASGFGALHRDAHVSKYQDGFQDHSGCSCCAVSAHPCGCFLDVHGHHGPACSTAGVLGQLEPNRQHIRYGIWMGFCPRESVNASQRSDTCALQTWSWPRGLRCTKGPQLLLNDCQRCSHVLWHRDHEDVIRECHEVWFGPPFSLSIASNARC